MMSLPRHSSSLESLAQAVETLYTSNQAACLRIASKMLRRLRVIRQRSLIETTEIYELRIKGIVSLIAQDRGVSTAPSRTLSIATQLRALGEWRRAAYLVFECYMSDGSIPDPSKVRYWARWIIDSAPLDLRPQYVRVASLLRASCSVNDEDTELALRYYRKSSGEVPSEYRSVQIVSFLALYTESFHSSAKEMWPIVGQTMLNSTGEIDERSRLKEILRLYSLKSDTVQRVKQAQYLEAVASIAERKGFYSIKAQVLNLRVSHSFDKNNSELYAREMDFALSYGKIQCGKTAKCTRLAVSSLTTSNVGFHVVVDVLRKYLPRMSRCRPHTTQQFAHLTTAEITLYPEKIQSIARRFLKRYDAHARERISGSILLPAFKFAEKGHDIRVSSGNHLCIDAAIRVIREQYLGAISDEGRMRSVLHGIRRFVPKEGNSVLSVHAMQRLSLAKVRHDLKYYLAPVQQLLAEAESGGNVSGEALREALRTLLAMFRSSGGQHTIEEFLKDIRNVVNAVSTLTQMPPVEIDEPPTVPHRKVITDRYDDVMSIVFNAIHNAVVHGRPSTTAKLSMGIVADTLIVECRNALKDSNNKSEGCVEPSNRYPRGQEELDVMATPTSHGAGSKILVQLAEKLGLPLDVRIDNEQYVLQLSVPLC